MEFWIGERIDTAGSYIPTTCSEVVLRYRVPGKREDMYRFDTRFGESFYISDEKVIEELKELLVRDDSSKTYEYLYKLIIERFGMTRLLVQIGHVISHERNEGYKFGRSTLQRELRELLGVKGE